MNNNPKLRFKDKNGNAYPEWNSKQFDEVFEILQNNTFSRKELNYSNKSVKNIHYGDILINYPLNLNCQICEIPNINQDIDLSKYKSSSYLQNGDVIFADTAEDETVGKACELYNVQEKMLSGLHTIPCRPKFNFASKYLGYFLNSNLYHNQLLPLITGIKVSSVSKSSIKTTEIYYPCIEEQEKIAGFLNKVDELINECEGEVKDLEEQKKGLLQKIFSQQIRFKDSNNNPYPDWEYIPVGKVFNTITDFVAAGSFADLRKNVEYQNQPSFAQLIRTVDLKKKFQQDDAVYVNETAFKFLWRVNLDENSLILPNIGANIGEVYYVTPNKLPYSNNVLGPNAILLKSSKNNLFYLYTYAQTDYFKKALFLQVGASGQPKFNKTDLKTIDIPIPCLEEQEKIAKVLSKMDELIEEKKALLSDWQQFKKGLLQQMFV